MAEQKIRKTGYLWKQGGSFKNWKIRYFVLRENCLEYYKEEKDEIPKGTINLKTGRGVRTRDQCDLDWPDKAKPGRCFGVAVENRTFYFYGDDRGAVEDWMASIQEIITRVGTPSSDCGADTLNSTETKASKMMRGGVKIMSKMTKKLSKRKGDREKKRSSSASIDSTSAAMANSTSSIEEFYDDVDYDEEDGSGNGQDEAVYDDVEPDPLTQFTASPEAYENVQVGTKPWSGDKQSSKPLQEEVTTEAPMEETIEEDDEDDEYYDDDDSFTSEIYENI